MEHTRVWYCTDSLSINQIPKAIIFTREGTTVTGITPPLMNFFDDKMENSKVILACMKLQRQFWFCMWWGWKSGVLSSRSVKLSKNKLFLKIPISELKVPAFSGRLPKWICNTTFSLEVSLPVSCYDRKCATKPLTCFSWDSFNLYN